MFLPRRAAARRPFCVRSPWRVGPALLTATESGVGPVKPDNHPPPVQAHGQNRADPVKGRQPFWLNQTQVGAG